MKKWPHSLWTLSKDQIKEHCVNDLEWQKFRLTLKGLPTEEKLDRLNEWRAAGGVIAHIQVTNYINALKRGGQLNMALEVQR